MNSRKTVILGAGGFVGRNLATRLIDEGHSPTLVNPVHSSVYPDEVIQIKTRITNFGVLDRIVKPGSVVHYLIGDMTPSNSGQMPSAYVATNLTLFIRFLEWARDIGNIHIVYASSGGTIYGECDTQPTPESIIPDPRSFYGLLKWTSERHLQLFAAQSDLTYTIARLSNPYGPGQALKYGQGLIPEVVARILANDTINVIGRGEAIRDYIHISDVTAALCDCGANERLVNKTVNIATGFGHSVIEVIREIEAVLNRKAILDFKPQRPGDLASNVLDVSLMKALTGWSPQYNLATGLRSYL